jgi:hypothetical protein
MTSPEKSAGVPGRQNHRTGCLGCLWRVGVGLFLALVFMAAVTAFLYPWAFYLGGKFHILAYWQGWGELHAKSGVYVLFVRIEPTPRGSRLYPRSNLTGVSYLCTPRGERYRLSLGGDMRLHLNLSTDGEPVHLYMIYWPLWYGQFITDHRPNLDFRGHWRNPDLVMDDHGSISRAFQPDGAVSRSPSLRVLTQNLRRRAQRSIAELASRKARHCLDIGVQELHLSDLEVKRRQDDKCFPGVRKKSATKTPGIVSPM